MWSSTVIIFTGIFAILTVLMCYQESRKRKISFLTALIYSLLLTPIISYIIILNRPLRNARGCEWCGNAKNEAEICGKCGKQTKHPGPEASDHLVE